MITRFEDIEAWQTARELCQAVGGVISKGAFAKSYALKDQIDRSSGSAMDNCRRIQWRVDCRIYTIPCICPTLVPGGAKPAIPSP